MERDILQLVREGRRDEAVAVLLPLYRDRVFALAISILKQRDWAEDVAQEAFVRIWRGLPAFDGRSALSTWIYAITRNTALSALRSAKPTAALPDDWESGSLESANSAEDFHAPNSYGALEAAVDGARIEQWLGRLPEKHQQVLRLYYLREHSVEEVAALLGLPVGTVKTLLFRGRELLRQALAGGAT